MPLTTVMRQRETQMPLQTISAPNGSAGGGQSNPPLPLPPHDISWMSAQGNGKETLLKKSRRTILPNSTPCNEPEELKTIKDTGRQLTYKHYTSQGIGNLLTRALPTGQLVDKFH
ncbi:hypothetical protein BaRGS_00033102 [Batillaria attramentaria]|uniref:Uncharacterized protein n=1 Tax=Batillaria attramentaria TaxID=370345 RepID=A0ABD0JLE5_9CAEN